MCVAICFAFLHSDAYRSIVQALASQYQLLCSLIERNSRLRGAGSHSDEEAVIPLPFILLQAGANAVMDVQLSKDEQSAVVDFGGCAMLCLAALKSASYFDL